MKSKSVILFYLLFICSFVHSVSAQDIIRGVIKDRRTNSPIEYVSIGIKDRGIGTVSSTNGSFLLKIDNYLEHDNITFSCIGFETHEIRIKDIIENNTNDFYLNEKTFNLNDVIIKPIYTKEKILGNTYNGKKILAGFANNQKGFEVGILLKIKKKAFLEKLTCNIAECTYDSINYRLNVYKEIGNKQYENILKNTIYIKQKIDKQNMILQVDLTDYNIIVEGNTLISLEHIEDMGEGQLLFSGGIVKGSNCYIRKTSQGTWERVRIKLGINVTAQIEE